MGWIHLQLQLRNPMSGLVEGQTIALRAEDGTTHLLTLEGGSRKVKGLGVIDPLLTLSGKKPGDTINLGVRTFTILPPRLPELIGGMKRTAQTISAKDAGFFITRLGIGESDVVVEAGFGSGGLSLHLLRVLGSKGKLISVDNREDHAQTGLANVESALKAWGGTAQHSCIIGDIVEVVEQMPRDLDAIILDLPDHVAAINAISGHLKQGGRIGCYCPVSSQLEAAIEACENAGLKIDWAGELMQREWGRASKGGMRPVNGPFGHTAFLLVALKI